MGHLLIFLLVLALLEELKSKIILLFLNFLCFLLSSMAFQPISFALSPPSVLLEISIEIFLSSNLLPCLKIVQSIVEILTSLCSPFFIFATMFSKFEQFYFLPYIFPHWFKLLNPFFFLFLLKFVLFLFFLFIWNFLLICWFFWWLHCIYAMTDNIGARKIGYSWIFRNTRLLFKSLNFLCLLFRNILC